jgi:LPS-assembly lipoprotein
MSSYKILSVSVALLVLSACGFRPLYGSDNGDTSLEFSRIKVEPIPDRVGQILHNNLLTALNPKGLAGKPIYVLNTELTQGSISLAVRKSTFATRANLNARATFRLTRVQDGIKLYSGQSDITVSYNILDSEFGTIAAQKDARSRALRELSHGIRTQLGVYFSQFKAQGN